ncbi:MAG TPA: PQQ-dependent dehydrogenase, methanol/ethanol family [Vicinamibacterales bacterium]|nr:PQQ-dependent dehydrogenase, methanol/ethanol family [Vicinamibacterales bacterium]
MSRMRHPSRVSRVGIVVLAATGALGGAMPWAAQAPPQSDAVVNPLAGNPAAIQAGTRLFDSFCADCHGGNGIGNNKGPALNTGSFKHGGDDAGLFRTIKNGIPGTEMDANANVPDNQIWQLVAYIRSLAPVAERGPAASASAIGGSAAAGEAVFFGKGACATCHDINGRGGAVGSDLSGAGQLSVTTLRQAILDPNTMPQPAGGQRGGGRGGGRGGPARPVTVVVKYRDGREVRGIRRSEDTFSLQLIDATGRFHFIDKMAADVRIDPVSLMPAYKDRLTEEEITNLVAYLAAQRGRDTTRTAGVPIAGGISYERLTAADKEPHNWTMFWGNYRGTHYSALKQIDTTNVGRLQAQWASPIPGDSILEATPIVVDGIMYVTGSGNPLTVTALDAKTGRPIWRYTRQQPVKNPYENNRFNRGVAMLDNRLFVGTLDAVLIALDARSGAMLWQVQMADTMEGYELTSPPLVVKDTVIMGMGGGEYATRGFIDAYDAASGTRLWRFYTVPGPGEFGNETWKGDSWQKGGSGAWLTPTFDPDLNLVYVPVGNPAPQIDRSVRGDGLDNLFSSSVVALDATTGLRKWHYQFTPNDGRDWDSTEDMVLVDRMWKGQPRKLLLHADRNGFFYVLDRVTGEFLQATPFVYQNWNKGFDAKGRPIEVPGANSSPEGTFLVYPTLVGGTNYQPPSYSPLTGFFYLQYAESGQQYVSGPAEYGRGQQYIGRAQGRGAPPARGPNDPPPSAGIKALDVDTGKTVWDFKIFQGSLTNGVLATGGNVLFGSIRDGNVAALDARTGKPLWHFQTGAAIAATPISYAVDGRQYMAVAAGNFVYGFALPQ